MLMITKSTRSKDSYNAPERKVSKHVIRGTRLITVLQFCAVLSTILVINIGVSLHAASSPTRLITQPELAFQGGRIDRAHKGDRFTPFGRLDGAALAPGCELPFSSILKIAAPDVNARWLT